MREDYYAYLLIRPWNNIPCYAGKGKKGRHKAHFYGQSNRHLANIFKKAKRLGMKIISRKVCEGLTETEAFRTEEFLIAEYGIAKDGGCLANATYGGEGTSGYKFSKESKEKMRLQKLGKRMSEETKYKMFLVNIGKKMSPEAIEKTRQKNLGRKRSEQTKSYLSFLAKNRVGWKHSIETIEKMKATAIKIEKKFPDGAHEKSIIACTGRKKSPEEIEKTRQKNLGRKRSPEAIEKTRLGNIGKKRSEETKAKLRGPKSEEHKRKLSESKKGKPGHKKTEEQKMIMKQKTTARWRDKRKNELFDGLRLIAENPNWL